jgi:hypothetical protein
MLKPSKWSISLRYPHQTLYAPLLSPVWATCPTSLILFDLMTWITFRKKYRSQSFSLRVLHCDYNCKYTYKLNEAVPFLKTNRSLNDQEISHIFRNPRVHYCLTFAKSVHHHTIRIIQPTRSNSFTSLLLDVYAWLNTFWASPRPSSGAHGCARSLWFYRWREAAGALLVMVWQTTTNNAPTATH